MRAFPFFLGYGRGGGGTAYGAGGGTDGYHQKADSNGDLADAGFEETVAGEIRSTGNLVHIRNNIGEFFTTILKLTSQGYSKSTLFEQGDGLLFKTARLWLRDEGSTNEAADFRFTDNQIYYSAAPVYNDVAATELTADNTTVSVTKPPRRIILTADANYNIVGLSANQIDGMSVVLENSSAFTITLRNEHASATAANRFELPSGNEVFLVTKACVALVYNGTSARWRVETFV